jgi:hypothetical protein
MRKNRRCMRRSLPALKMWPLLLQSTLPQPPPSTMLILLRGQKMIIVMIRGPIKTLVVRTVVEMTPVILRLPRQ